MERDTGPPPPNPFFNGHTTWHTEHAQPATEPTPSAVEVWSLNYCATRDVLLTIICFLFFWPFHVACGILVSQPEIEPEPLDCKHEILTTGPPGKPLSTAS